MISNLRICFLIQVVHSDFSERFFLTGELHGFKLVGDKVAYLIVKLNLNYLISSFLSFSHENILAK